MSESDTPGSAGPSEPPGSAGPSETPGSAGGEPPAAPPPAAPPAATGPPPSDGGSGGSVSRKGFLQGAVGAAAGGLIVGGGIGYAIGHSGSSSSESSSGGSGNSGGGGGGTIKVGAAIPITGPFAGDGEQMLRGQEMAVSEINDAGGIGGSKIELVKLDTKDQSPDVMKTVMQNLVSQNVAAIFMPFCSYTSVEFPIIANQKVPAFHVNTWHGNVDWVAEHKATNIFQGDPSELSYGAGIVAVVNALIASGDFKPRDKTAYVVTSNDPYSLNIAQSFQKSITDEGWDVVGFEKFTVPQANWGGTLVNIRQANPDVIVFSDYAAGDEAAFIKQFAQSPTKSLVYQQYAPSIPQYLQLAGDAANGVIWSTVVGMLQNDPVAQPFIDEFTQKFNARPGFSNAGDQYDLMQDVGAGGRPGGRPVRLRQGQHVHQDTPYAASTERTRSTNDRLTCIAYPDNTADPSIGMAHLTFQIQDGQQEIISPEPYTTGKFQLPPWLQ